MQNNKRIIPQPHLPIMLIHLHRTRILKKHLLSLKVLQVHFPPPASHGPLSQKLLKILDRWI